MLCVRARAFGGWKLMSGVFPLCFFTLFCKATGFTGWSMRYKEPSCLGPVRVTDVCRWASVHMGAEGLNSGPHACVAGTVPNEPSPHATTKSVDKDQNPGLCRVAWLLRASGGISPTPDLASRGCPLLVTLPHSTSLPAFPSPSSS